MSPQGDDIYTGPSPDFPPADSGGGSASPFASLNSPLLAGGIGALGLGAILAKGESPLPQEYAQLTGSVPNLRAEAGSLEQQGQTFTNQGAQALAMAQRGELTPEQQAQLSQYNTGLTNQARQQFASMGRNPDQDTAFINQSADITAQVNAMAQSQIQSTIALGLGETQAGASFAGAGLGFESAANSALLEAGKAQLQQDKSYGDSLTSAFAAIGSMFGSIAKTAGPALLAA